MKITPKQILTELKELGTLREVLGNSDTPITGIKSVETAGPGDLTFVNHVNQLDLVKSNRPSVVVISEKLSKQFSELKDLVLITAANDKLAHAIIKQKYGDRDYTLTGWPQVHPSAIIHESAEIAPSVFIEPRVVIGRGVKIGSRTRIMAGVVIENDAVIGEDTVIHPNAVIGYKCRIGNSVNIGAGSIVGSEGFGFAQDSKGKSHPIPQTGIVVIEDRVRLGANNCIDRAAYDVTRIGAGTKLDNFVHVAHNVQIGQDCLLTAFFCVAGSTKIGNRVMASGHTGVLDHMNICDDVVLVHRAGVSNDITKPGVYGGTPTQPLNEYMRNQAVLRNAVELRKRVLDLEKQTKE